MKQKPTRPEKAKTMKTIKKGNRTSELTEKKWSNGKPVLRLLHESCDTYPDAIEEETYTCPSTGLKMTMAGEQVSGI